MKSVTLGYGVVSLLLLTAVWQWVVWLSGVPSFILPGPVDVLKALVANFALIMEHAQVTAMEVLLGMLLGTTLGAATALYLMWSPLACRLALPALILSQTIPVFALAPILTLWLGYGLASKIAMTILIIYFPVTSTFLDGLRATPMGYLDLARCMQADRLNILFRVRLPAALPALVSGLKLAAVYAPIGAVIGEWVGASRGLGYLMLLANGRVKTDLMFAALVALCVFTLLLRGGVGWLGRYLNRF